MKRKSSRSPREVVGPKDVTEKSTSAVTEGSVLSITCLYCHESVDLNVHTIRWSVWDKTKPIPTLEYNLDHECPSLKVLLKDDNKES